MSRHEELADKLEEYATYLKLDGQEGRAHAYEKAARSIRSAGYVPPNPARLDGVGDSIRTTIARYQRSGEIEDLQDLKDEYSWYEDLRNVDGIGPARAKEIHHKFRVDSVQDLLLVGSDLEMLTGIGQKTRESIMDSARQVRDER